MASALYKGRWVLHRRQEPPAAEVWPGGPTGVTEELVSTKDYDSVVLGIEFEGDLTATVDVEVLSLDETGDWMVLATAGGLTHRETLFVETYGSSIVVMPTAFAGAATAVNFKLLAGVRAI